MRKKMMFCVFFSLFWCLAFSISPTLAVVTATAPPIPSNPSPADNAINVPVNSILSWEGGNIDDGITYEVYLGTNTTTWKKYPVSKPLFSPFYPTGLQANTQYYWKVVSQNTDDETKEGPVWSFKTGTVSENQSPYEPSNPSPADESKDVSVTTSLSWKGGDPDGDEVTYYVYFGRDIHPSYVGSQTQTTYNPGTLDSNATYNWQILSEDSEGNVAYGEMWTFKTGATEPVSDTRLAADFGDKGLYLYNGRTWTGLVGWNAENITAWLYSLIADFGDKGLYLYDGNSWSGLVAWDAESLQIWKNRVVADFGEKGLYLYDGGSWTALMSEWDAESMAIWKDNLIVDFGENGVWMRDASKWTGLVAWNPESMTVWNDKLLADFGDKGLWIYNGTTWSGLVAWNAENMTAWNGKLMADFGENGLWTYNGTSWTGLVAWNPENMIAWDDKLLADFGENGLWTYNGTTWTGLVNWNAESMTVWEDQLVADFGENGVWLYDGSKWTGLVGWDVEDMEVLGF